MLYLVCLQACFHSFDSWQRDGHFMQDKTHLPLKLLCQIFHTVSSNNQKYKWIPLLNNKPWLNACIEYFHSPTESTLLLLLYWCIYDSVSHYVIISFMATVSSKAAGRAMLLIHRWPCTCLLSSAAACVTQPSMCNCSGADASRRIFLSSHSIKWTKFSKIEWTLNYINNGIKNLC